MKEPCWLYKIWMTRWDIWKDFSTFVEIWKRMARNLQQRIARLQSKASLLTDRYKAVKRAKEEVESREMQLRAEVARLRREISVKDAEIERLKVTSVLTPDHKDVEVTRAFLSELVREIDKCIAQLSI